MLKILCDKCGEEINEGAALVFSPPTGNMVGKYHICVDCWNRLDFWLKGGEEIVITHWSNLEEK
jgi:hypothetical protein